MLIKDMISVLSEIYSSVLEMKRIKEQIKHLEKFLKGGRFFPNNSKTLWAKNSEYFQYENRYILKELMFKTDRASKLNSLLFSNGYRVQYSKKGSKVFNGDALMLSRIPGEGKIIDYEKGLILSFFPTERRMNDILLKRQMWESLGYNIVQMISKGKDYFVESYIVKHSFDTKEAIEFIMQDSLIRQSRNDDRVVYKVSKETLTKIRKVFCDNVYQGIDLFVNTNEYVKRTCHGDLYRNNLIYDGRQFYYIDFELTGPYVFFFDIIYFMWFEYYRYGDESYIRKYFNGEYDSYFEQLFYINGCKFEGEKKNSYYGITLFEYFCEQFHTQIPQILMKYPISRK